ncbi:MAG: superinfection exclusion protein [Candidatus Heimdallarchaeota archaeon]|nr:MAG: superinfection exclusion protein [Candidatus Heimdallarchaeota archaeon]
MNELRVWWVPQMPMQPFYVEVGTVKEGVKLMDILADYDNFQYDNNIKGDYSNTGGIEIFADNEEWEAWEHESEIGFFDNPREYLEVLEDVT